MRKIYEYLRDLLEPVVYFPYDKFKHILAGAGIYIVGFYAVVLIIYFRTGGFLFVDISVKPNISLILGIIPMLFVLLIGVLKEFYDFVTKKGTAEFADIVATLIGGFIVYLITYFWFYLIGKA